MHSDDFWSGYSSQPSSLSKAHIYLPDLKFEDRWGKRKYKLRGVCVENCFDWDGSLSSPRWCVVVHACDDRLEEAIIFKTWVMWSAVKRDAMADYDPHDRGRALGLMARERIEQYLRIHPHPNQSSYMSEYKINLEYA